jgi:hypothetical protein
LSERLLTAAELAGYLGLKPGTVLDKWSGASSPASSSGAPSASISTRCWRRVGRTRGGTCLANHPHPAKAVIYVLSSEPKEAR